MTDIEKLRELEAKATKGPWRALEAISECWYGESVRETWANGSGYIKLLMRAGDPERQFARFEDAALCAEMRNALPGLLDLLASNAAEIERLRTLTETLKTQASCHAMEARGANATIHEAYQAVTGAKGEPGNWNGARRSPQPEIEK